MNENAIIQYVRKKRGKSNIFGKIAVLAILALILIICSQIEAMRDVMLIIAAGCVLCVSALLRNFTLEYEYKLSEGFLTVTAVFGVSKRRTELHCELSSISESAPVGSEDADAIISRATELYDFSSSPEADGRIVFFAGADALAFILEPNAELSAALLRRDEE